MSRYVTYNPEQVWLLPPSVREELGEGHLAVFVHELVERLDLRGFEQESSAQGRPGYPPQLLLEVWLYAYALGVTSSRRIEQRLHEDLGFRLLAGHLKPDHWTLNEFRKRHSKGLNDVFTQVVEAARGLGLGQLGRVAIDSTRVAANASPDRSDNLDQLRRERARIRQRIRRWQKQCDLDEQEPSGGAAPTPERWQQRLEEIPRQMEQLRKSGQRRGSRSDPESRYLRTRGGFCLGYTAEIAAVEAGGVEVFVPDRLMARELAGVAVVAEMNARQKRRHPGLQQLRERMREPAARSCYQRRKALVEPVFGVLKQQRGMRQFRRRGLPAVGAEWALATTAYNLTRLFGRRSRV